MKRKILAIGLLSACCLMAIVGDSQAFFGLFHHPWHHHNRYVTQITCRPYNAFTPICWGNLNCDGCCPNPCAIAGGCMPMNFGGPSFGGCGVPCMGDACGASDMPMAGNMPRPMSAPASMPTPGYGYPMPHYGYPMPNIYNQPFTPPMPQTAPQPMPPGPNFGMYNPMYHGVAQANYYPMYMPQYAPNYSMPMYYPQQGWQNTAPAPYYWYGAGR
jgi:hypothetical protein